jgi:low affinity Fe/Cu permease
MEQATQIERLKEQSAAHRFFCAIQDAFRVFARTTSHVLGSAWAFVMALLIIAVWAATGPMFGFSDTWQLIINTGTTIVTFLMVFLIQNTQNRDAKAVHLKLDEIIRAIKGARNELVDLEELSDEDLKKLEEQFRLLRERAETRGINRRHVIPDDSDQTI